MRIGLLAWTFGLFLLVLTTSIVSADDPLPAWLDKAISELQRSRSRDVIEEATYNGRKVFVFISGDRADTGDEQVLIGEDGKEICQFGGFVGRVTAGACDIGKINYVRTLYRRKSL